MISEFICHNAELYVYSAIKSIASRISSIKRHFETKHKNNYFFDYLHKKYQFFLRVICSIMTFLIVLV